MLKVIYSLRQLDFYSLIRVHEQSILHDGMLNYPGESSEQQRIIAEQEFYNYLRSFFFEEKSFYALWIEDGQYMSAARLQPYRDGFLLTGLETMPDVRGKGYAGMLLASVKEFLKFTGVTNIYSRVEKKNSFSLSAHKTAGFEVISESARYLDGSVTSNAYTLCLNLQ